MKKRTIAKQILISTGLFVFSFFVVFIFSDGLMSTISPKYDRMVGDEYVHPLVGVLAISLSIVIICFESLFSKIRYSSLCRNYAENIKRNINISTNNRIRLYKKATKIFNKYLDHESNTYKSLSNDDNRIINSSREFKTVLKMYPDLQSIKGLTHLLNQIERSEQETVQMKQSYNEAVSLYNDTLTQISIMIFTKNKRMDYYEEELISDEEFDFWCRAPLKTQLSDETYKLQEFKTLLNQCFVFLRTDFLINSRVFRGALQCIKNEDTANKLINKQEI